MARVEQENSKRFAIATVGALSMAGIISIAALRGDGNGQTHGSVRIPHTPTPPPSVESIPPLVPVPQLQTAEGGTINLPTGNKE